MAEFLKVWGMLGLVIAAGFVAAYQYVYVALAEVLDGILLTSDRPLSSRSPGMARRVVFVDAEHPDG